MSARELAKTRIGDTLRLKTVKGETVLMTVTALEYSRVRHCYVAQVNHAVHPVTLKLWEPRHSTFDGVPSVVEVD